MNELIFQTEVSWYQNIKDTMSQNKESIAQILYGIKTGGQFAAQVEKVRAELDPEKRKYLKQDLPVIMWQGVFSKRSKAGLQYLNGIICIDVDHISAEEIARLKDKMKNTPWVVSAFLSPSGDGLKILVNTTVTTVKDFDNCYAQLIETFSEMFGCDVDKNCRDYSRACYASYDPDIYVNPDPEFYSYFYNPQYDGMPTYTNGQIGSNGTYVITPSTPQNAFLNMLNAQCQGLTDEQILEILDRRFHRYPKNYMVGHRRDSIFKQAGVLCRAGIDQQKASEYLISQFIPTGFPAAELSDEVFKSYRANAAVYGSERGNYKSYSEYKRQRL